MKKKSNKIPFIIVSLSVILFSIIQGTVSVYQLRQAIEQQANNRLIENNIVAARLTASDVHYNVYKILGTMNPYKMDEFNKSYHALINDLIAQCSEINISTYQTIELKELYDTIVDLHYKFAVNMAKDKMEKQARNLHEDLLEQINSKSIKVTKDMDQFLSRKVMSSILLIISFAIITTLALLAMLFYLNKSIAAKQVVDEKLIEAYKALRKEEENLRTILNSIGDAVIATDINGNISHMNPIAENITGWTFEEAKNQHLSKVFNIINKTTREKHPDPIKLILDKNEVVFLEDETILISKTGDEVAVADSGAPIIGEGNSVDGVVLIFRDITEIINTEERLRQSQKMDAIGQLAGGVAHDFNNMLSGILNAAELLKHSTSLNSEDKEFLGLIITASTRAADLTGKLLSFSRKGKIVSSLIDIHTIINESIALLKRSVDKRIEIQSILKADFSQIEGDASQIQNAILNLGINARDAMEEGGTILIRTENTELDHIFCSSSGFNLKPGNYICIEVSDTGIGMSKDIQKHIFEPFYTTKEVNKGTGLGLAAVYGIINDHLGAIFVSSKIGIGTKFKLYFPLKTTTEIKLKPKPTKLIKGNGHILVIDDEDIVRKTTEISLKRLGFTVTTASDGLDGLEKYSRDVNSFDFVVLDMIMPKMSGEECFNEIYKLNPDQKILICSGYTRDISFRKLMKSNKHLFLQKPYTLEDLSKKLNEFQHN